jgi:very-short-patch-repair endonuclease
MREGQKKYLARVLRGNATEAERIMWRLLRDRRFGGVKFRRQVPIGPFIADFASIEHRLVVELDGGQHADSQTDVRRDRFLEAHGWRVVRFWNNEVMTNREGVLEVIHDALCTGPHPAAARPPSPASGRGGRWLTPAAGRTPARR